MKYLLHCLLICCIPDAAFSCSCFPWSNNFYDNVSKYSFNGVVRLDSVYMDTTKFPDLPMGRFTLIRSFNFPTEQAGDTLVMYGQDGVNCAIGFSEFNIGDSLVVALARDVDHYLIPFFGSGCGVHYMRIVNGMSFGLTIDEIEEKIEQVISSVNEPKEEAFTLFPNPVAGTVYFKNGIPEDANMTFFDMTGKAVLKRKAYKGQQSIDISLLPTGMYIVQIHTDEFSRAFELLKIGID